MNIDLEIAIRERPGSAASSAHALAADGGASGLATDGCGRGGCPAAAAVGDDERPKILEDVKQALKARPRSRKTAGLISSLNSCGRLLDKPLAEIPADPQALGALLAKAVPASAGLRKLRVERIWSDARQALHEVGISVMRGRDSGGISAAWREFARHLRRGDQIALSRLMSSLSREGVGPLVVTTPDIDRYRDAFLGTSLHRDPQRAWRRTVRAWNRAVAFAPGAAGRAPAAG